MPAIFELIVMHRIRAASAWSASSRRRFRRFKQRPRGTRSVTLIVNCEWRSHTDCTNTGQLRCHNCSSGMTAMKILTRIEIPPVEGPQSISWHLIGSMLLLAVTGSYCYQTIVLYTYFSCNYDTPMGRFILYLILIFWYLFTAVRFPSGVSGR
jgi:hypothetical protein